MSSTCKLKQKAQQMKKRKEKRKETILLKKHALTQLFLLYESHRHIQVIAILKLGLNWTETDGI